MTRRSYQIYWPIHTSDQWPGDWIATQDNYDGAPDSGSPIGTGPTREAAIESLLEQVLDRQFDCDHVGCGHDKCQAAVDSMLDLQELIQRAIAEGK